MLKNSELATLTQRDYVVAVALTLDEDGREWCLVDMENKTGRTVRTADSVRAPHTISP